MLFLLAIDKIGVRLDLNSFYSQVFTQRPCSYYQKDKWAKPGNLPKSNALSEIEEHWIQKCFHFLSTGK